jgi:hypothetical protein
MTARLRVGYLPSLRGPKPVDPTRQTDGHDATTRAATATWRRPTTWRRRCAGGAQVRERGPILASQPPRAWFGVHGGTGVEPVRQFRPVHLGRSACRHVCLIRRGPRKVRHGRVACALGAHISGARGATRSRVWRASPRVGARHGGGGNARSQHKQQTLYASPAGRLHCPSDGWPWP